MTEKTTLDLEAIIARDAEWGENRTPTKSTSGFEYAMIDRAALIAEVRALRGLLAEMVEAIELSDEGVGDDVLNVMFKMRARLSDQEKEV